jgi:uncharacterized membrane protein YbhN (UPF0104 family)
LCGRRSATTINPTGTAHQLKVLFVSATSAKPLRSLLFLTAKMAIVLVVFAAVAQSFRDAFGQLGEQIWVVQLPWLVAAAVLYLLSLLPMAIFWRSILAGLEHWPGLLRVLRAYSLGHLAKYVPGKALTLVVRAAGVHIDGRSTAPVVVSVFVETLALMAVGGFLSAILLPRVLPERASYPLLTMLFALATALPTIPPIANRILQSAVRKRQPPEPAESGAIVIEYSWRLFFGGWLAACVSWLFMGLSIWATVRAVGVTDAEPLGQLDLWVVSAAMPVVGGFLSMIPGGLVVRDGLMFQLLGPAVGEATALVVTALVRLTWLVAECAACGILEVTARWSQRAKL